MTFKDCLMTLILNYRHYRTLASPCELSKVQKFGAEKPQVVGDIESNSSATSISSEKLFYYRIIITAKVTSDSDIFFSKHKQTE
uniref:Uncharacterized protein n=1 Tax=Phlebotomus papatasi TaxID=29031 RepID=A0A1B0D0N9_PHLPP